MELQAWLNGVIKDSVSFVSQLFSSAISFMLGLPVPSCDNGARVPCSLSLLQVGVGGTYSQETLLEDRASKIPLSQWPGPSQS